MEKKSTKVRIRKKRVPETTNNITVAIINKLKIDGHVPARINTQGQFVPVNKSQMAVWSGLEHSTMKMVRALNASGYMVGQLQKTGSTKGVADIIVCMKPSGQYVAIEIKNAQTKDRMSKDQEDYKDAIIDTGGTYLVITRYQEFLDWYEKAKRQLYSNGMLSGEL